MTCPASPLVERRGGNAPQHAPKHHLVDGPQKIPIEQPAQAARFELRDLSEHRERAIGFSAELEPRATRYFHLRKQPQPPPGLIELHAPEIQRTSRQRSLGIGPAAPHADSTRYQIEESANSP